jgi:hypothetical protein
MKLYVEDYATFLVDLIFEKKEAETYLPQILDYFTTF